MSDALLEVEDPLLEVEDLRVVFTRRGRGKAKLAAVDGVSFTIRSGEIVGLVGESGSGKSTIGRTILGLQQSTSGKVKLGGQSVVSDDRHYARADPRRLQAVFQDPYGSLNPSRTVGRTLIEPMEFTSKLTRAEAEAAQRRLLESVGLPKDSALRYPDGFSGGQRQRICIARAVSTTPQLVICDEAVSALDVVTRASVLNTLIDLQRDGAMAILFISHDLTVTAHISQRIVVLYRGRIMEQGPAESIYGQPKHPYTRALLAAVLVADPTLQNKRRADRQSSVAVTTANAPTPNPAGCPFAPRCPSAADVCHTAKPADTPVDDSIVACHLYDPSSGHPDALSRPGVRSTASNRGHMRAHG